MVSLKNNEARILKPYLCGRGYLYVEINGKNRRVHKLVADAFLPKDEGLTVVHHKDHNKLNNRLENLERTTQSENMKAYYKAKKGGLLDEN